MRFSADRWKKVQATVNKPYGLDSIIYFGKYKNTPVRNIISEDHKYIRYLIDECNKEFDGEALELLERYEEYDEIR